MASSSTRSTKTEQSLVHDYRIAHARLCSAGLNQQAKFITKAFADILDIDKGQLKAALEPVYHANRDSPPSWKADIKLWNALRESNTKLPRSERIEKAENALADAGAKLFRAGRKAEGEEFCRYGEVIGTFAVEAWEREEAVKRRREEWVDMEVDS